MGQSIPPMTDAPNAQPGEQYQCFSCHSLEFFTQTSSFEEFRDCTVCHQLKPGQPNTVHHRSERAIAGNCEDCHAIPTFAQDRPRQAACRQCHGQFMHDNGGPIQDYGACTSCHNDVMNTAPPTLPALSPARYGKPVPFHAKPPRAVGYTRIPGSGGWKAGKGVFSLFWCQFTDCGQDQEDTFLEDIEPNGDDMDDEGGFRWRRPTVDFTFKRIVNNGRSYNVPSFDEVGGPPPADSPPVVTPQSPQNGQTVSGFVQIKVGASDDKAVSKVEFRIDQGTGMTMSGPNGAKSGTWSATWDSRTIPAGSQHYVALDGPHVISVRATDSSSQTTIRTISVEVQNDSGPDGDSPDTGDDNLALHNSASASRQDYRYPAANAVDGSTSTFWWSRDDEDEWLMVDLGATYRISKVVVDWHRYYAEEYEVRVSRDRRSWSRVKEVEEGNGGRDELSFYPRDARYVRIDCKEADEDEGFAIKELEVYR